MPKNLSNRQRQLSIGVKSYTESQTVFDVTGKVGIGTTIASSTLTVCGQVGITSTLTVTALNPAWGGDIPAKLLSVREDEDSSWNTCVGIATDQPLTTLSRLFPELSVRGTIISSETLETLGDLWVDGVSFIQDLECSGLLVKGDGAITGELNLGALNVTNVYVSGLIYGDGSKLINVNANNIFPTQIGDYKPLNAAVVDAFGQSLLGKFDCSRPDGELIVDLGSL
jgi:hypothetical protein